MFRVFVAFHLLIFFNAAVVADQRTDTAQAMLDGLQQTTGVPGLSVAVARHGKILWAGGAGYMDAANRVPVGKDTRFRFASTSKLFTATLAAILAEKGLLDVDAPIGGYAPHLPANMHQMTMRQLLAHTSGLPHYQLVDQGRTHGNVHYDSVSDAMKILQDRMLQSVPGTAYLYSSHGYTVASAVLEAAGGAEYLDLLEQHITRPLGIPSIQAEDVRVPHQDRSKIYRLTARGAAEISKPGDNSHSWAGAGKEGSAVDLARFGSAVVDGTLLKPETLALVQKETLLENGESVGRYFFRLGLGWRIGTDPAGRRVMHHAGVTEGARSTLVVYPDEGIAVAFLSNSRWVASVERTASAFALPFLDRTYQQAAEIPAGAYGDGRFADDAMQGVISTDCRSQDGELSDTRALTKALRGYNHADDHAGRWPLYCAAKLDGVSYYALATTIGMVTLARADAATHAPLEGVIGQSRTITLSLLDKAQ